MRTFFFFGCSCSCSYSPFPVYPFFDLFWVDFSSRPLPWSSILHMSCSRPYISAHYWRLYFLSTKLHVSLFYPYEVPPHLCGPYFCAVLLILVDDYLSKKKKSRECLWMLDVDRAFWVDTPDPHSELVGFKVICFGAFNRPFKGQWIGGGEGKAKRSG